MLGEVGLADDVRGRRLTVDGDARCRVGVGARAAQPLIAAGGPGGAGPHARCGRERVADVGRAGDRRRCRGDGRGGAIGHHTEGHRDRPGAHRAVLGHAAAEREPCLERHAGERRRVARPCADSGARRGLGGEALEPLHGRRQRRRCCRRIVPRRGSVVRQGGREAGQRRRRTDPAEVGGGRP